MMKRRPVRGIVLTKSFNSTYMPPLDSLTVLCGQPLVVDCPRFVSATPLHAGVTVAGKGEEITGLGVGLPALRLKADELRLKTLSVQLARSLQKARTNPNVFPFMKLDFAVRNSFSRTQETSEQTTQTRTAPHTDFVYNKQVFLKTSSEPVDLAVLFSGSQGLGRQHKDGLTYQEFDQKGSMSGTRPRLDGGDTSSGQPATNQHGRSLCSRPSLNEGCDLTTLTDDNCGESSAVLLSETDVMGKNKAATKRQPFKHSARRPATLPSPIKPSHQARALSKLATRSQSPRPIHKSKVRVLATALPASRSQRSSRPKEKVEYAEYLPVSGPDDDLTDLDLAETIRSPTKKKERRNRKTASGDGDLPELIRSSSSVFMYSKRGSLTYSDDSDNDRKSDVSDMSDFSVSAFNPRLPNVDVNSQLSRTPRMCHVLQTISNTGTPKRGTQKRDKDYEEEQRRQQLADQRRRKQQHIYNKLRSKPWQLTRVQSDSNVSGHVSFDNYDFLARYCILNRENSDTYRQIFDQVDEHRRGWLSQEQTAAALKEVNGKLTDTEQQFLFRIMEITGYNVNDGTDFRLFATLAALSQKITALDSWMRLMVREMNLQLLEMTTFLCKRLWEVCVDPNTGAMNVDQLMVELRSGGISRRHQQQVQKQLGHLSSLDLIDFLTYSPLFIKIHQSVIENPLSDTGIK